MAEPGNRGQEAGCGCCTPVDSASQALPLPETRAAVDQVVTIGKALSDPIRVRMLGLMALGRNCCQLPDAAVPVPAADLTGDGICVCEFTAFYGLGQSKVSYHLRILKDAGLITEDVRGKWTYYALNRKRLAHLVSCLKALMGEDKEVGIHG